MKRITHLLTGMAVGAAASRLLDGGLELVLLGALAGVLPDLDVLLKPLHPEVHRSAWSHSIGASMAASAALLLFMTVLSPVLLDWDIGETESLACAGVVFLSMFMHSAGDSFTRSGCRLLYPFSKRRFSGPFRYDDVVANATLSLAAMAAIAILLLAEA